VGRTIIVKNIYSLINLNIMNFFFLHPTNKITAPAEHELVKLHEPPHNTTEGSEFLDDAIRTREQPLMQTEESIAVGCPEYLL
jgi:hypothetical protein